RFDRPDSVAPTCLDAVYLHDALPILNAQEAAQRFRAAAIAKGTGAGADDRTLHAEMGAAVSFLDEAGEIGGSMLRDLLRDPSPRSEEHTSELQSRSDRVCRHRPEKKK